jgi:hypothetical protein
MTEIIGAEDNLRTYTFYFQMERSQKAEGREGSQHHPDESFDCGC